MSLRVCAISWAEDFLWGLRPAHLSSSSSMFGTLGIKLRGFAGDLLSCKDLQLGPQPVLYAVKDADDGS